jgi:hypothetical protein
LVVSCVLGRSGQSFDRFHHSDLPDQVA